MALSRSSSALIFLVNQCWAILLVAYAAFGNGVSVLILGQPDATVFINEQEKEGKGL